MSTHGKQPLVQPNENTFLHSFKIGVFSSTDRIDKKVVDDLNKALTNGPAIAILQFHRVPLKEQKERLSLAGIRLLNYLGGYAYTAIAERPLAESGLTAAGVRAVMTLQPKDKIHASLNIAAQTGLSKGRSPVAQVYSFTDNSSIISGVHNYRIKSVDVYGNSAYTDAIPVFFSDELAWQVYPILRRVHSTWFTSLRRVLFCR